MIVVWLLLTVPWACLCLVCDCGISRSYSLTFLLHMLIKRNIPIIQINDCVHASSDVSDETAWMW